MAIAAHVASLFPERFEIDATPAEDDPGIDLQPTEEPRRLCRLRAISGELRHNAATGR